MLFNSIHYLLFLPIVIILFFSIPHKYRWVLLLVASYYFYMCWKMEYALLMLGSTSVDYIAAIQMGKQITQVKRKKWLFLSIISNLGVLISFKYLNFFNETIKDIFNHFNVLYEAPLFNILLPIGISFYTFQSMSYIIDVYRGKKSVEKHFGIYSLYIAFFPQLVAGPILRASDLLPQFYEKKSFDYQKMLSGLHLVLWGFFKKVVIADRVAIYVNEVYGHPGQYEGVTVMLAVVFFAFQLYYDFSGYSDIAIGTARIMGFNFMENFRQPFLSKSVAEFWKRWHISLSTWFQDYLYIPLGGNRVIKWRWYYNLFITFLVSGIWHGANWTFIFWGALHGLYLIFGIKTKIWRDGLFKLIIPKKLFMLNTWLDIITTFLLFAFSLILFRSNNLENARIIFSSIFSNNFNTVAIPDVFQPYEIKLSVAFIILCETVSYFQRKPWMKLYINAIHPVIKGFVYILFIFILLQFGMFHATNEFIYFQF